MQRNTLTRLGLRDQGRMRPRANRANRANRSPAIPIYSPADRNLGRPLPLENTVNDITTEFLQCPPENEAMRRAQQWFAEGRHLSWLPIFSQANFPGVPIDILEWADRAPFQSAWPISRLEDFMGLPPGITGWLLPEGDDDTDMVVAVWEGFAHFLSVRDLRTGEPQTLMSGRNREMEGQGGIPVKDVGTYPQ